MAWIKRNLYFFIGGLVSVAALVAGGFYLYSQISTAKESKAKIDEQQAELQRLIAQNPHPGYGTIDNIGAAKAEAKAIQAYIAKARTMFQPIAPIPEVGPGGKISNAEFNTGLRNTINELQHSAEQQSVIVAKDYYFTFESQRKSVVFDPLSLPRVAEQLGEVKAICDILFAARVNSLDYVRREAVSADDKNQSDYVTAKSVTVAGGLAEVSPYEVKFRCFSPELALVMANLASSPYGLVVKTINVEPTSAGGEEGAAQIDPVTGTATPNTAVPAQRMIYDRRLRREVPAPGGAQVTPPVANTAKGGPQKLLSEKLFAVTLHIDVVKLKAETAKPGKAKR